MNLKKKFLDRKGFVREQSLHTMKSNKYLKEGDIILVADTGFYYDVIATSTDIPLQNSLFAQVKENSLVRWVKQHIAKLVTPSEDGHMRKEDKRKIDGVEENANNYSHPTGEGYNHLPRGGSLNMVLMWASLGTAKWINLNDYYYTEKELDEILKNYSKTNHNHDTSYYKKIESDEKLKMKLGVNDTAKNSEKLGNASSSKNKDANSIAQRDSAGDLSARLFKSDYPYENRMDGGLAFRVSEKDNYIRFCSDKDAIKGWLGISSTEKEERLDLDGIFNIWGGSRTIKLTEEARKYKVIMIKAGGSTMDVHFLNLIPNQLIKSRDHDRNGGGEIRVQWDGGVNITIWHYVYRDGQTGRCEGVYGLL